MCWRTCCLRPGLITVQEYLTDSFLSVLPSAHRSRSIPPFFFSPPRLKGRFTQITKGNIFSYSTTRGVEPRGREFGFYPTGFWDICNSESNVSTTEGLRSLKSRFRWSWSPEDESDLTWVILCVCLVPPAGQIFHIRLVKLTLDVHLLDWPHVWCGRSWCRWRWWCQIKWIAVKFAPVRMN